MSKTQTQTQTPNRTANNAATVQRTLTANGVEKGRPGKGRVLSLEQRAYCYAEPKHRMTEANTFRYTAKRVKGQPKPIERAWCRKCRALSRKRSHDRRVAEAKAEAKRQAREVKAQLAQALPKARKASKPKAKAATATPRKAKAVKAANARKAATARKRSKVAA